MHVFKYINTTRGNAYCKFIFKKFSKGKHANHKRLLFRTGVSWQKNNKTHVDIKAKIYGLFAFIELYQKHILTNLLTVL